MENLDQILPIGGLGLGFFGAAWYILRAVVRFQTNVTARLEAEVERLNGKIDSQRSKFDKQEGHIESLHGDMRELRERIIACEAEKALLRRALAAAGVDIEGVT